MVTIYALKVLFRKYCSVRVVQYVLFSTCCSVRVVRYVLFGNKGESGATLRTVQ